MVDGGASSPARRVAAWASRFGASPDEGAEERLRRHIFLTTLTAAIPFSGGLALLLGYRGLRLVSDLCAAMTAIWVLLLLSVGVFRGRLNAIALTAQYSCVLTSFAGTIALGGPLHSGGLPVIGLLGPLYALVFPHLGRAVWVFAAYVLSIVVEALIGGRIAWARPLPPAENLVLSGTLLATVSGFVFVTLLYFVRDRSRALGLLREAQDQISRLLASAPRASETIPEWSRSLASDIGSAIGADGIGIWQFDEGLLTPVSNDEVGEPSADEIARLSTAGSSRFVESAGRIVVALAGPSGELCGALVVRGRTVGWGESERRLLVGLSHQLGAALDMSRLRRQLTVAEERRAQTRQELHERGIATLQMCRRCGRCYDHTAARCADDGAPLVAPRTLPYRLHDRYRFLRVIGEGGMGMVVAAHDERLDRDVAVKLIRPEHFNDAGLKERFEREARAVARIQHPGVIELHDSGELDDGTAFLVMEKLTGCDLGAMMKRHGCGTPAQVAVLVQQASAALGAAHRAGFVHRDIKPENIFLVDEPAGFRVKVLDFGLAKSTAAERGVTRTGAVVGTPRYMAPEQVLGSDVDAAADVYSFAAVIYEALTGRTAASGNDLATILVNVCHETPQPPSSLVPGLPDALDRLFAAALAKERTVRPADIEQWGASVVRALEQASREADGAGWQMSEDVTRLSSRHVPGPTSETR